MSSTIESEKLGAMHIEQEDDKSIEESKQGDYSGATTKTSQAEIALVRKLDMRIMPALFCMYFL